MRPWQWPALPTCLSCVAGVLIAASGETRAIPGGVAVLALGLAAKASVRSSAVGIAVGLISGWLAEPEPVPKPDTPIVLVAHLTGPWVTDAAGSTVAIRGEWIREGWRVRAWRGRAFLSVPAGTEPPAAFRMRVRGFLRRAPPTANGVQTRRPGWHLYAKSGRLVEAVPDSGLLPVVHAVSARVRSEIRKVLRTPELAGSPGAHLVQALVLGESWTLPGSWRRGLAACGLSHLVALSGLHVGLLAGMALTLAIRLPMGFRMALVVGLTIGYLLFVGPRPSLIRACFMLMGVCLALWLARPPLPGNSLITVAGAMVTADPHMIGDLGFRLTFSATMGIVVLSRWLAGRWTLIPSWLTRPLSVTVGAQVATLPWALPSFHLFTPLSPIWNLIAIPWTAIALAVGVAWSLTAVAFPNLAVKLGFVVDALAMPFAVLADLPPTLTRPIIVDWGFWESMVVAVLLVALLGGSRMLQLPSFVLLVVIASCRVSPEAGSMEVVLLDVGQGESILLRDGASTALIDGGGWRRADIGSRILLPVLASLGVRQLDALVLSHPDLDHCGGLLEIASFLPAREVWSAPGWRATGCVAQLHGLPGVSIRSLWAGEEVAMGRWQLEVLNPWPGARGGVNDRSLVLLASFQGRRVLLTGDIEAGAEAKLLTAYRESLEEVDILKVAHHGSRTSTTPGWLEHTRPGLALLSAGIGNHYGHPAPEVLERLQSRGIRLLRTDVHGLVRISFHPDGRSSIRLPGMPREAGWPR